jgi:hypothetical protein
MSTSEAVPLGSSVPSPRESTLVFAGLHVLPMTEQSSVSIRKSCGRLKYPPRSGFQTVGPSTTALPNSYNRRERGFLSFCMARSLRRRSESACCLTRPTSEALSSQPVSPDRMVTIATMASIRMVTIGKGWLPPARVLRGPPGCTWMPW